MGLNFELLKIRPARKNAWVLAVLVVFFYSCDSLVSILPESRVGTHESKLVVHCYLSVGDTLITAYVTESLPVFKERTSNEHRVVSFAEVKLSGSGRQVVLTFNEHTRAYTAKADVLGGILPGETYRIDVTDGIRAVNAVTTVPSTAYPITSYKTDTTYHVSFSTFDTLLVVQFRWDDPVGIGNYYRVAGQARVVSDYREYGDNGQYVDKRGTFVVPLEWDERYGQSEFQSDAGADGAPMESPPGRVRLNRPILGYSEQGPNYAVRPNEVRQVTLDLFHTDEHYFKYHRSVALHREAGDNPFAEPVLIYSNVQGGLGVFASYHSFSIGIKP